MRLLIWKSLMHRKLQSLVLILSIAVGAGIVFCVTALYDGVASGMELSNQRMGADIVIIPGGTTLEPSLVLFGGATANAYMPETLVESVRTVPGIHRATPQFFTHTLTADCHDIGSSIRMVGYDLASDWIIKPWLKEIDKSSLQDDEVILGAKVQTWTEDRISILGKWYKIVTIAAETGTTLDYSLFVNMAEARRVVGKDPSLQTVWKKQGAPQQLVSAILVQTEPGAKLSDILTQIRSLEYYVQPIVAAEIKNRIQNQFTALTWLLGGIGILTILAALFQLFSRLYAFTWERQAEWGLFLALGASGRDIAAIIVGEAVILALSGVLTGLLLGGGMYRTALTVLQSYQSFPFVSPTWQFLAVASCVLIGLFVGLGALAAWLPAYHGSKVEPSIVMTRGEFD